ncbi:MAG: cytochrome c-type biogenesis CcmF C-terminal domain-containing protein, partial [Steroidobacter sp.]
KKASFESTKSILLILLGVAVVLALAIPLAFYGWNSVMTSVGLIAAFWVAGAALVDPISRWRKGHSLPANIIGMSVAHFGLAMFIIGATTVESYKEEADLSLKPGQSVEHAGFVFSVTKLENVAGPNFEAVQSEVVITRDGKQIAVRHPQKRVYRVQKSAMTEAGIDAGWNRDLFVAMGEPLGDGAWSYRLQYKPMVRFVWLGAAIMALGGLIAACDRRYRKRVTVNEGVDAAAADAKTA